MKHEFDVKIAKRTGLKSAIVLDVLKAWGDIACKIEDLRGEMPYFTEQEIQRALNNLVTWNYIALNNGYVLLNTQRGGK